jgi:hypothetical protein
MLGGWSNGLFQQGNDVRARQANPGWHFWMTLPEGCRTFFNALNIHTKMQLTLGSCLSIWSSSQPPPRALATSRLA